MVPDPPAGTGPTYPPSPPPRVDDWHEDPELRPILRRYPILRELLDREGVNGVYRWARVAKDEADAYALRSAGLTFKAIGDMMDPVRNERTVEELVARAQDRIVHALAYVDPFLATAV